MEADAHGFPRPLVDFGVCIRCGGCDAVCPALNGNEVVLPQSVLWAKSRDEAEKFRSSSGGLFALFAHEVLSAGGIVVGAAWGPGCKTLRHVVVEDERELDSIMRSKYVQSSISREVYETVRDSLRHGRKVLFTGTACQVEAMRAYLGKLSQSEGLLCVDVICHGVPSPRLWCHWLEFRESACGTEVRGANFRSKTAGWLSFCVQYAYCTQKDKSPRVESTVFSDDWYMRAFLKNASLRGSCFQCPSKRSCGSDVTIGDFWGVQTAHPDVDYANGVSALLVNTAKGAAALDSIMPYMECGESSLDKVLPGNPCLELPVKPHPDRDAFMRAVADDMSIPAMQRLWAFEPTIGQKVRARLAAVKRRLLGGYGGLRA